MPLYIALIIGIALALIITILVYMFVVPNSARKHLPGFLRVIHDLVNFKTMILEPVIKILYLFCSVGCICVGILLLFGSSWIVGIILLIAGPLVLRIIYEMIMLFVLQVQNTISINRKLK